MPNIDFNALGQAIDTTWGRSSTPKTASYSVKFSVLTSDTLEASYVAVVNFASEREMAVAKREYAEESTRVIAGILTAVKSRYKELSGSTLKTKELKTSDSVEIINMSLASPRRTAYFRRKTVFSIG